MVAPQTMLVVGTGSIGRRHLANLRQLYPNARLVVLCRPESASSVHPSANCVVTTIEAAVTERPQLAIVANPAPFHVQIAQALAKAGCHLLIEKPLSDRFDGIEQLIDTCRRNGGVLMVGYTLRFFPSLREMVRHATEGTVGRVLHVAAEIGQHLPDWRPDSDYRAGVTARADLGGGALLELSHEIDIALWLGGQVNEVTARLGRVSDLEIDTEDIADLMLEFGTGARATIHLDLLQRVPYRRTRVIGSHGTLEWDGIADTLRLGRPGAGWELLPTPPLQQRNDLYLSELEHFIDCINSRAEPITNAVTARRVLAVILAARESAASDRTIKLEPSESVYTTI